tara:strand:- start:55 stop:471 length:417 start_codon:yes stop_codon:yes gene_type:complete
MSTLVTANIQNTGSGAPTVKNSSGTEIGQFARAWVQFQSTNTFTVRNSFNVSSVSDDATGRYTVNFDTAFTNVNYAFTGKAQQMDTNDDGNFKSVNERKHTGATRSTTSFPADSSDWIKDFNGGLQNADRISLIFFGD